MGRDEADIRKELQERLTEVHEMTEGFFAPDAAPEGGEDVTHAFDEDVIARWESYPAMRSVRAVEIFNRVRPEILRRLAQAPKPDEALLALDGFLRGLPAGVQLFSLFEANPQLIDLVVDIVGTAPALAQHLSRNSGGFAAGIGGRILHGVRGGGAGAGGTLWGVGTPSRGAFRQPAVYRFRQHRSPRSCP